MVGTPSDALVYRWRDGWERVGQEFDVELVEAVDVELIEPTALSDR